MTEQERPRTVPYAVWAVAGITELQRMQLEQHGYHIVRTEDVEAARTEKPTTKAGLDLYRDTREGMTILQDAMRSRILAIEAEGRQQAVRLLEDAENLIRSYVPEGSRLREQWLSEVAGLNASESPNNNPGGEDHTLQVLPDDSFYCLKCQQAVPPDHSALDTNERPGPFDLAELTGTIENAPIGHLQTALGGNGEPLALWIKRMYGQRLRVGDASESPPTHYIGDDCTEDDLEHTEWFERDDGPRGIGDGEVFDSEAFMAGARASRDNRAEIDADGAASESPRPDEWPYDRLPTPPDQLREAEVLARMRQAARVDACPDHDEKGAADEASGFPTCSKCGAILTGDASESGQPPEAKR